MDIAISLLEKERERNIYQEEKGHLHFKKRPFFPLMDRKRGMRYRKRSHQERDMWCHKKPARLFEIGNAVIEEHGTFKCQEKSQFKKKEKKDNAGTLWSIRDASYSRCHASSIRQPKVLYELKTALSGRNNTNVKHTVAKTWKNIRKAKKCFMFFRVFCFQNNDRVNSYGFVWHKAQVARKFPMLDA